MCFENIYACKEKLYTIFLSKYIILNGYTPENPLLLKKLVCFAKNDCYVSYLQGFWYNHDDICKKTHSSINNYL